MVLKNFQRGVFSAKLLGLHFLSVVCGLPMSSIQVPGTSGGSIPDAILGMVLQNTKPFRESKLLSFLTIIEGRAECFPIFEKSTICQKGMIRKCFQTADWITYTWKDTQSHEDQGSGSGRRSKKTKQANQ
jgi:hypothetical protein